MKYPFNLFPTLADVEFIYCPVLGAIGVPINLMAIIILSRRTCGLSKCVNRYLVAMAAADLLVVFTDVMLRWFTIYFPISFLDITFVCSLIEVLMFATTVCSVWLTVAFTFDRFVALCCKKLRTKYCTEKTALVVVATVSVLGCLESIPWFFKYRAKYTFNNLEWFCIKKADYYTSIFWTVYVLLHRFLTPLVPFLLIVLFNILTVRHIFMASKARRRLWMETEREGPGDPEMERRRKSIILLFSISGSFILLWMTNVTCFIHQRIAFVYGSSPPSPTMGTIGYLLQLLSTCTNTCIYTVTQSQFREQLKTVVKYPFSLIRRAIKL
ncbi:probable G-protein coupled receptor 139 [Stegostoma tigrinum]|uniref:probable G-protein coupled receptor 139 n=1 Tax=Stegostoma tigrinum TaxID=3053191 RepID=UPI002870A3D2|nr:probable G-protein coupled receptor 139 [Stegostoma tigrinum]